MSFSIQTNVNSLVAQENLRVNSLFQSRTIQRLTSGYRINSSGDDAAGLAVANKFRSSIAELTQGVANANDGVAQLQIMDGGMNNIAKMLDRLKTLAAQSASGTFTGDRNTLNSEFQTDVAEIDRQAQSIGLNTGGIFAKSLSVYLGAGSGSTSAANAVVNSDLTRSAVDSQSLGLKGFQAIGGSADIGTGSSTSVQNILADLVNAGSEATPGSADFYFVGPGFSDASKVKVSVNLTGVSDTTSLVKAVNTAIAAAGGGASQAGAAFQSANIVASVHTDANGGKQLAFTSSTSAFQVEAGDRMANALMGNFTGPNSTTGAVLQTTITGEATAASGSFSPANKTVQISGAGLASPVQLTFSSNDSTVSDAITDLVNQVSQNVALKAAGISVSGTAGNPLVFTSARGESFSVMSTGDATNQLGLGSFVTNASASNAVDYSSITGTSYNYGTANNDHATMQFSINGAAATAVNLDLTGGDAVAAARSTSIVSNPNIQLGVNDTLNFSVDGIAVSATLSGAGEYAVATGTPVVGGGGLAITKATASHTVGSAAISATDWSSSPDTFTVAVNGAPAQTIYLTTNYTGTANDAALQTQINNQLRGATASISSGMLTITADTPGTTGNVVIGGSAASALNGGGSWTQTAATNGNNKIMVSVDGGAAKEIDVLNGGGNVTFAQNGSNLTTFQAALDTAFGGGAVTVGLDAGHHFTLTSATLGAASGVTVSDLPTGLDTNNSGMAAMFGVATVTAQGAATSPSSIASTIQSAINTAVASNGTPNAGATVTVNDDGSLTITNNNKGAGHTISAFTGNAAVGGSQFLGNGSAGAVAGRNRSGSDMANYLDQQFSSVSGLKPAQLQAVWTPGMGTAGTLQIVSGNGTNFRINSGSVGTASMTTSATDLAGGINFSIANQKFRISVDGGSTWAAITLNTDTTAAGKAGADNVVAALNTAFGNAGVAATATEVVSSGHYYVTLASNATGSGASIQLQGPTSGTSALASGKILDGLGTHEVTADADLGFGVSGASFTASALSGAGASANLTSSAPLNHIIDAGGASSANVTVNNVTNSLSFNALRFGNDKQAVTISAIAPDGSQQSTTITLQNLAGGSNNRAGANIDSAISYINAQLQQSNNPTLQKIVAVKENNSGDQINFMSSLSSFNVSVASTANAGDGINGGASDNVNVGVVGSGANLSIDTQAGAQAAVTAIGGAIAALGSAQAAVGIGENQLGYAIGLAQSQISNFSSAEAQLRDADVAAEAANLTKAQVLQQATMAAMAQANSAPQAVLALLRG